MFFWGARRKAVVGGGGAFLFAGFAIRVVIGDAVRNVSTMPPLALAPGFAYAPIGRRFGNSCKPPPPCHSRLRAGILGGLVRGIALPPRLLSSLPTPPRVPGQARNDGANAPFVPFCTAAPQPHGVMPHLMRHPASAALCVRGRGCAAVALACASLLGAGSVPA